MVGIEYMNREYDGSSCMGYAWPGGCQIKAFCAGGVVYMEKSVLRLSMTTGRLMHEAWTERDSW